MRSKQNNLSLVPMILALLFFACGSQGLGDGQNAGVSQNASGSLDHLLTARGDRPGNGRRCEETTPEWRNFRFDTVATGFFTIRLSATLVGDPADAVIAVGDDAGQGPSDFALLVQAKDGRFEARDGDHYSGNIPIVPNTPYRIELSGSIPDQTYSVRINEETLLSGGKFRSNYTGGASLGALGLWRDPSSGSFIVCDWTLATDGNQFPVAKAGPDQTKEDSDGNGSETVTLDGSGSYDPDGTIVSYQWFEGDQLLATGKVVQVTLPLGVHTLTLVVKDNAGAAASDALTVTINQPGGGNCEFKPGPMNTGPSNPNILVDSGPLKITQNGAVVENLDISGKVEIEANDVTLRNFRISTGAPYGIEIKYGYSGIVIEDGEIQGMSSAGIYGGGFTARKLHIHESGHDGIKPRYDAQVFSSWIHHLGTIEGAHADTVQIRGGFNFFFQCNNFDIPKGLSGYRSNAVGIIAPETGPVGNTIFDSNWANGGNYTFYDRDNAYGCPAGTVISYNLLGSDYSYGILSSDCPTVFTNNLCESTGQPPVNNQCP